MPLPLPTLMAAPVDVDDVVDALASLYDDVECSVIEALTAAVMQLAALAADRPETEFVMQRLAVQLDEQASRVA